MMLKLQTHGGSALSHCYHYTKQTHCSQCKMLSQLLPEYSGEGEGSNCWSMVLTLQSEKRLPTDDVNVFQRIEKITEFLCLKRSWRAIAHCFLYMPQPIVLGPIH